ncbi:MAG: alanine racemase, partial [Bacillota bacterium]|nr:alanine racemase [Bacillota bacterium]
SAIVHNLNQIKSAVNSETKIVPVIKANGYGSDSCTIAKILHENGINMFAVADTSEAIKLRKAGINQNILLLYQPSMKEIDNITDYNLTSSVCDLKFIEKLNDKAMQKNKLMKVHVEIDTGMGRLGIKPEDSLQFFKKIMEFKHIETEGIFMHYASADSMGTAEMGYSKKQTEIFNAVIKELKGNSIDIKYIHASSSSAIFNYPEANYNMVRPGFVLYGYYPNDFFKKMVNLKPSFKLVSEIIFIKEVPEGTNTGYGSTFTTKRKSKIAAVAIGYSDGLRRALSNKGYICVNNKKAPIVGRINMDITMIDITDIPGVKVGDEAAVFDNELITIEDIAEICDTIGYEIISTISENVKREFISL